MITEKEYLNDWRSMNKEEKKDYLDRTVKWSEETFPELLALADCWQHVPVKDFDEGCRLVSAIINARPFLSSVYRYEAARALKKMNLFLADVRKKSGMAEHRTRKGNEHFRAIVPHEGVPDENGTLKRKEYKEETIDGLRPKDFVLYKDRLPQELRIRGEQELPGMYLELADYRGRLEAMAEHPDISDEARADMAEKAVRAEQKIRSFWAEVDGFLKGETPETQPEPLFDMKRPGEYTREEIEQMPDIQMRDACKKARIELDKKYIRRSDVKVTDEYKKELALRVKELIEWGEALPKKTADVLNVAGVVVAGINDSQPVTEETEQPSETPSEKGGENATD